MSDRKAQLVARIQELLAARKAELKAIAELERSGPRVRLIRTFAVLMLMAAPLSAEARTVSRSPMVVTSQGRTTVVYIAPQQYQPEPRKPEPVDRWAAAWAAYFQRM